MLWRAAMWRLSRLIAGTTRDVIEVHLDLDGYPINCSTRPRSEIALTIQLNRRRSAARKLPARREADLVLWLVDATSDTSGESSIFGRSGECRKLADSYKN